MCDSPEETTFIYALVDPRDGVIKYVGKSYDPQERLKGHFKNCKRTVTLKNRWIAKLKSLDLKPNITILEEVALSEWEDKEQYWIRELQNQGYPLKNGDRGGKGRSRFVVSEETRRKISLANTGRRHSEEIKHKISLANTGKKRTDEQKNRIGLASMGRIHTLEARQKMSQSRLGVPKPEGFGEKVSKAHKGRVFSKETRQRMSEARKDWKPSPEMTKAQKEKCSGEGNGRAKFTEDDIRNIRAEYDKDGVSISALARKRKVNWSTMKKIVTRKSWKSVKG